jgi:hypothetical protein
MDHQATPNTTDSMQQPAIVTIGGWSTGIPISFAELKRKPRSTATNGSLYDLLNGCKAEGVRRLSATMHPTFPEAYRVDWNSVTPTVDMSEQPIIRSKLRGYSVFTGPVFRGY